MKVTNNKIGPGTSPLDTSKTGKADGNKAVNPNLNTRAQEANSKGKTENVNVSERAQMMQKAKDIASNGDIDEAKVARLQKLIDEGKYKTDAKAIADKLVDEHLSIPD
jgi:negative regulator of flagellin synthesis FlgM